jgi:hypothetical protein
VTLYYCDISSFQGGISLAGALVVCIKATEGTTYVSPQYGPQMAEAARRGTWAFAYHFLHHGSAPAQAAHAHATVGATPLMLDFEPIDGTTSYPSLADAVSFIDAYRTLGGVCHLVYLPRWYWSRPVAQHGLGSPSLAPLASRGMVLVSSAYTTYTDEPSGAGWQPYGGMTPAVWQYTDALNFNGQPVDFNAYRGTYPGRQDSASVLATVAEFRSLATTGKLPAPPAPASVKETAMSAITQRPHVDPVPASAKTLVIGADPGAQDLSVVTVRAALHSGGGRPPPAAGWAVTTVSLTPAAVTAHVPCAGRDLASLIVETSGAQAGYGFA